MIYCVHAESASPRTPGTCPCVRTSPRTEPYPVIAARFEIGPATLMRWVQRQREPGTVDPLAKGGGWVSPVVWGGTQAVDRRQARPDMRGTHPGIQPRGAERSGASLQHLASAPPDWVWLQKTRSRLAEQDRARVQAERAAFRAWAQTLAAERLVFLDESGANLAMGRWPDTARLCAAGRARPHGRAGPRSRPCPRRSHCGHFS